MTNGNVPASDLIAVEGILLERATATDYLAWKVAAARAGHIMLIAQPWGGYRPYAIQAAMRAAYLAHNYAAYNLSPPPSPVPAPAGESRHGFGRAVDIAGAIGPGTFRDWVRATAAQFGFHLWTTADANHFEHGNALVAAALNENPVSGNSAPTIDPAQEDDMARYMARTDGTLHTTAIFDETRWQEFNDSTTSGAAACVFIQKSFPGVAFDSGVWAYRSDAHPEIKRPFYTFDVTKNTLTPIDYQGAPSAPVPTIDYAALAKAVNDDAAARLAKL